MKLVTYRSKPQDAGRLGILHNDLVIDMEKFGKAINLSLPNSMLDFIELGNIAVIEVSNTLKKIEQKYLIGNSLPISNTHFLAPIPEPKRNIFGIGLNYTEHVAESARSLDTTGKLPQKCIIFSKPTTAVIAPNEPVLRNEKITQQLDFEGELAVIIGSKATQIKKENALKHVFGYTIINDISARDCRREGQWIVSKGQDSYAPMGPYILTADELPNPHNLQIITKLNGVEKQNSNTKFMLFNVNAIIEDVSEVISLVPGDIIASGTPSGVGAGRTPQEFMVPGDLVEITIDMLGTLRNPIVKSY